MATRKKSPPATPGTPVTRGDRKEDTRQRIRRAAWDLFSTKGFAATTTKEIADRAGVAAGTVFVHASDKEDLLFLVMHDRLDEVVQKQLATLPTGPLVDRLMHVFRGLFRLYAGHPDVGRELVRRLAGSRGPNAQRMTTMTFGFFQRLAGLVAEAQAKGEVAADVPTVLAAQNFFSAYMMTLFAWLDGYGPLEGGLDATLADALKLQIRGLRP